MGAEVALDVDGLVALATSLRKKIESALDALRNPDFDDADRVEAALDILQN